ncbi:hypothetical protein SODALDRAFT_323684 [Sodiomyces alkalinus F11]|uniref:Uncharacterized protein n=1 Tax=Sodiomyces alkalinus (strain CBS 110278 / VKM F-3762 / F11) TaxID=1314773 RepID=A0A3N2PXL5_SODAK|nr:hypothetical protein SODALDRAFT_323684 [Sodiomyces alkalinus F11]ROT39273.1 hypothetical protein SODALDRAFT_323684 [Sodiomyces alkalinus F11]
MGGKHWSLQEEEVFWTCVVPRSSKRIVRDPCVPEMSWDKLVGVMEAEMAARNIPPRRQYTGLSLFEHFFLNIDQRHFSPNARRFAQRYLRQRDVAAQKEKNMNEQKTGPEDADPVLESAAVSDKELALAVALAEEATINSSHRVDRVTPAPGREAASAVAPETQTPASKVIRTSARDKENRYLPFHPVNPRGRAPVQRQRADLEPYQESSQRRDERHGLAHPHLDRNHAHRDNLQYLARRVIDLDHPFHARREDCGPSSCHGISPMDHRRVGPGHVSYVSPYPAPRPDERYEMSGALPAPPTHVNERWLPPVSELLRIASRAPLPPPHERSLSPSPETRPVGGPSHRGYPTHHLPPRSEEQMPTSRHVYPRPGVAYFPLHARAVGPVQFPEEQYYQARQDQREDSTATTTTTYMTSDGGMDGTDYDGCDDEQSSVSDPSSYATPATHPKDIC